MYRLRRNLYVLAKPFCVASYARPPLCTDDATDSGCLRPAARNPSSTVPRQAAQASTCISEGLGLYPNNAPSVCPGTESALTTLPRSQTCSMRAGIQPASTSTPMLRDTSPAANRSSKKPVTWKKRRRSSRTVIAKNDQPSRMAVPRPSNAPRIVLRASRKTSQPSGTEPVPHPLLGDNNNGYRLVFLVFPP
jgi:hypothetical protein